MPRRKSSSTTGTGPDNTQPTELHAHRAPKSSTSSSGYALKPLTAGQLTDMALKTLRLRNFTVWRQNNLSVKGRKFIGMKGMPDIIGYGNGGRAVYCEVKTENDRLSQDQIEFMDGAHKAGCLVYMSVGFRGLSAFQSWADYRMINDASGDP